MTPRENALIAYHHGIPEWIPSRLMDINLTFPAPFIERYQGHETGTDGFGVEWKYEKATNAPMTTSNHLLQDITEWREKVMFPDLETINWEEQAKRDTAHFQKDKLNMAMNINGPFERIHACLGMMDTLCALVEEEEECIEFTRAIADHKIRLIDKVARYYNVDVFNMHDDYGMNDNMFMSLDTWRRIFKPQLKRIVEAVHEKGMLYEHHSCGFIEPIVPDLVEIGVDALDVWQVCNTNMRSIKDKYQKQLTFGGGFDNQGVFDKVGVTFEECYNETKRAVELMAPGGSYVAFTITVTNDFQPAFQKAMMDMRA